MPWLRGNGNTINTAKANKPSRRDRSKLTTTSLNMKMKIDNDFIWTWRWTWKTTGHSRHRGTCGCHQCWRTTATWWPAHERLLNVSQTWGALKQSCRLALCDKVHWTLMAKPPEGIARTQSWIPSSMMWSFQKDKRKSVQLMFWLKTHCLKLTLKVSAMSCVEKTDRFVVTKRGQRRLRQSTVGWQLLIAWKDGSESWIPLKVMKESNPVDASKMRHHHLKGQSKNEKDNTQTWSWSS